MCKICRLKVYRTSDLIFFNFGALTNFLHYITLPVRYWQTRKSPRAVQCKCWDAYHCVKIRIIAFNFLLKVQNPYSVWVLDHGLFGQCNNPVLTWLFKLSSFELLEFLLEIFCDKIYRLICSTVLAGIHVSTR